MGRRGQKPAVPIEQLIVEYEAGATGRDLAKKYDVSFQAIYQRLWNAGVIPDKHVWRTHRPHLVLPAETIIAAYQDGMTTEQLARAYGCSYWTICKLLERHGIPRRKSNYNGIPTEQLIAEYQAGASTVMLGKKYGMRQTAVWGRLSRAGVIRSCGWKLHRPKKGQTNGRASTLPDQAQADKYATGRDQRGASAAPNDDGGIRSDRRSQRDGHD